MVGKMGVQTVDYSGNKRDCTKVCSLGGKRVGMKVLSLVVR